MKHLPRQNTQDICQDRTCGTFATTAKTAAGTEQKRTHKTSAWTDHLEHPNRTKRTEHLPEQNCYRAHGVYARIAHTGHLPEQNTLGICRY